MTTRTSRRTFQLRLWALFMFFFIPGLLMASWATHTPTIRDQLMLSTTEIGVVLFGLSVGSMSGILYSAWLVERSSTRKVVRTTMFFAVLGMLALNPTLWVSSALLFAFGLTIFSTSFGSAGVTIDVGGTAIRREMNETVLPMMHGFYSLGTLFGIGVGMAVTRFGLPIVPHVLVAALVVILPIVIAIRATPNGAGKNAAEAAHGEAEGLPIWHDARLLLIGIIVLTMAFARGSANDWLLLLVVDDHGFSPASGSLIYTGFTLGMTLGRFTDSWSVDRCNRVTVVRGGAVMGALGIGLITFVNNPWVAGTSVLLWDIGASLGFPLAISVASDTRPDTPKRVNVVAITGYLVFPVGPPLLGFLDEHFDLRSTMIVVLDLTMVTTLVACAVAKPQSEPVMENS